MIHVIYDKSSFERWREALECVIKIYLSYHYLLLNPGSSYPSLDIESDTSTFVHDGLNCWIRTYLICGRGCTPLSHVPRSSLHLPQEPHCDVSILPRCTLHCSSNRLSFTNNILSASIIAWSILVLDAYRDLTPYSYKSLSKFCGHLTSFKMFGFKKINSTA